MDKLEGRGIFGLMSWWFRAILLKGAFLSYIYVINLGCFDAVWRCLEAFGLGWQGI